MFIPFYKLTFTSLTVIMAVVVAALFCSQASAAARQTADSKSESVDTIADADKDPYRLREIPPEGQDIGIVSQISKVLDLDIPFQNDQDKTIQLSELFDGKRPVMLSFNYSDCPKLCSVQLKNMTNTLREVDFEIGKDFQLVSISIDPNESVARARSSKEKFLSLYHRPKSGSSWHFLTGAETAIQTITQQCGFHYKYVPAQKRYSHPPVYILISPNGKIVRYIHGLDYDPDTIRLALIESAEGKIGSPINILSYGLGCFSYDPTTGKYAFQALSIVRMGGMLTVVGLLIGLVPYWFFRRDSNESDDDTTEQTSLDRLNQPT